MNPLMRKSWKKQESHLHESYLQNNFSAINNSHFAKPAKENASTIDEQRDFPQDGNCNTYINSTDVPKS